MYTNFQHLCSAQMAHTTAGDVMADLVNALCYIKCPSVVQSGTS